MSKPSYFSAHLAVFCVSLFYGINYFIAKGVFQYIPPLGLVALRSIGGIIFFTLIAKIFVKEKIQSPKDYFRLFICGLFGGSLTQIFFLEGLLRTTEVNASVFMITSPLFVFLIAWILKAEKMTPLKLVGLISAFTGAAFLSLGGRKLNINDKTVLGDFLIVINAAIYGYYLVMVRPLMLRYSVFTIIMWVFIFGGMVNILLGMPHLLSLDWENIPQKGYLGAGYVVLFATIGTYMLNAIALTKISSSAVSIYIYLQPVLVGLISMIWFDWILTGEKAIFMLMVVAGVVAVSYRKKTN